MATDRRTPGLGRALLVHAAGTLVATAVVTAAVGGVVSTVVACASGGGGHDTIAAGVTVRIHLGPGHTAADVRPVYARPEPGQPGGYRVSPTLWSTALHGPPPEEVVDAATLYLDTASAREVARATQFARLAAAVDELGRLDASPVAIVATVAAHLHDDDDDE